MRITGKVVAWSLMSLTFGTTVAVAQEREDSTANQLSSHPINPNDIMMKRTLWRRVDLKEKQNQPMFSKNNEISRYLLEAAKAGLLDAYTNDSCKTKLTPEILHKKLTIPNQTAGLSAEEIAAGFGQPAAGGTNDGWDAKKPEPTKSSEKPADDGWDKKEVKKADDDGWGTPTKKTTAKKNSKKKPAKKEEPKPVEVPKPVDNFQQQAVAATEEEFFPDQLSILEVKEEWTFDKKRSRLYTDIQSFTVYLPSEQNQATGLEVPVASFRYKDVERLFRSDPKKYIWYNAVNEAQHKNLADAFDLRLFYGRIVKYSNAGDKSMIDIYKGEKAGLLKSLQYEQELMEMEHDLWEY